MNTEESKKKTSVPKAWVKLAPKASHKVLRHNAFPVKARQLDKDFFEICCQVDPVHENFFFDHTIDHIPGMLLACIIRQSALVVSHTFYDVPYGKAFMMSMIETDYKGFADLGKDIMVQAQVLPFFKDQSLKKATLVADIFQEERLIASGRIEFRVYEKKALTRVINLKRLEQVGA